MLNLSIGDTVSVVNDSIKGTIIKMEGTFVWIEDEHGFEYEYKADQLVPYQTHTAYKLEEIKLGEEIEQKIRDQIEDKRTQLRKFEIDLHIEELLDDHRSMTNHEILTKQMNVCRQFVQNAIEKGSKKIVLIHGKGEGVLKAEIHSYLNKLKNYNGVY